MTNRRLAAFLMHMLLAPIVAGILFAGGDFYQEVRPIHDAGATPHAVEYYNQHILTTKPHNVWQTKDLVQAGFKGCIKVEDPAHMRGIPTAHVVRLPAAEGFNWVKMDAAEVAHRMEGFGGTPSKKDDVKIVGNCY